MSNASTILNKYLIDNIPYHKITSADKVEVRVLKKTALCKEHYVTKIVYPENLNGVLICYCNSDSSSHCDSNKGGGSGCRPHLKRNHYVTIINPPHALYATGYDQDNGTQLEYRCEGHRGIVETSNEENEEDEEGNENYFDNNLKAGEIINRTNISKIFEKLHNEITARLQHKFYSELDKPQ